MRSGAVCDVEGWPRVAACLSRGAFSYTVIRGMHTWERVWVHDEGVMVLTRHVDGTFEDYFVQVFSIYTPRVAV